MLYGDCSYSGTKCLYALTFNTNYNRTFLRARRNISETLYAVGHVAIMFPSVLDSVRGRVRPAASTHDKVIVSNR